MDDCSFFEYVEDCETMDMIQYALYYSKYIDTNMWEKYIDPYLNVIASDPPDDILFCTSTKICSNLAWCIANGANIMTPNLDELLDAVSDIDLVFKLMWWKFKQEWWFGYEQELFD